MAFSIPPYVDYPFEISPRPSRETDQPREGKLYAPLELVWETQGNCQNIDLGSRSTRPFSQIIMLDVDNTSSTVDAEFLFPDSQTSLVIPAGSGGRYPVSTSGIQFYAQCMQSPISTDITRVAVLNYASMPIDIPKSSFTSAETPAFVTLSAAGSTTLVAADIDGVFTGIEIIGWGTSAGAGGAAQIFIKDGDLNIIAQTMLVPPPGTTSGSAILLDISDVDVRFRGGVTLLLVTSLTGGTAVVNFYYRTVNT